MQQYLRSQLSLLRRMYRRRFPNRTAGLRDEIAFWDKWFRTRGLEWPDDYRQRLDPQRPLAAHLRPLADQVDAEAVDILDVGAGPLTIVGMQHPSKTLRIVATDLLAPHYDMLLARYQITPPIRTIAVAAEQVERHFGPDRFDIVHAQNCIDHTENPLVAIQSMLVATRPGGWIVLGHEDNEAEREGYTSLHQWNFTVDRGDFVVESRTARINITQQLATRAATSCALEGGWLSVTIQKRLALA
ncbi:class I SAM-dependent methyltransferase [Chloroflexia bacterium SDU3-3]|nr:class I SAM-dependent methyltransferase [Chloroflexia bacterium SDU3-3]